jgi:hypothetical protein
VRTPKGRAAIKPKYNTWSKKFDYKGPNLIAGYEI